MPSRLDGTAALFLRHNDLSLRPSFTT
jgi:hypothetical protein